LAGQYGRKKSGVQSEMVPYIKAVISGILGAMEREVADE